MRRTLNLPLAIGAAIVLLLIAVAVFGPGLSPRDPLERTLVARIGGRLIGVPFPPFQSAAFPLGSDRYGRDMLSRLLWAVRPTLALALIVAGVRLAIGVLIGALAGWSRGGAGRALSGLTDLALAVPVLVVALAAIAAVGIERGLPAFILGMALTGWAETAQTVRAQTRLVAAQPYIQAARALGANGPQILVRHIWRHIAPLLGTLFAFEVSSALMLAAGLGFLGYFIGGGVWVILSGELIPVAARVAGPPELGQMVGSADLRFSSRPPWEMIFPGLTLALAILGFTLLGEGLRRRQAEARPTGSPLGAAVGGRVEAALLDLAGRWDGRAAARLYGLAALAALLGGGAIWWRGAAAGGAAAPAITAPALPRPTGWPTARGDAYGTLAAEALPAQAPAPLWSFSDPQGLAGGPALAADGTIYLGGLGGALHALAPDGGERWRAALPAGAVGAPALAEDGTVYVVDQSGALSAFDPAGRRLWRFQNGYRTTATSGPIVGPDGTIYYAVIDAIQAVSPAGEGRWLGSNRRLPYLDGVVPRLSPDGAMVFLKNSAFSSADGGLIPLTVVPGEPVFADPIIFVGADGRSYYRSQHQIVPWRRVAAGVAVQAALSWGAANVVFLPADQGVTARGTAWLLYSTDYADTRLVWVGADGQFLGERLYPLRDSRAIAVDADGAALVCGSARNRRLGCALFAPGAGEDVVWDVDLGAVGGRVVGGAVVGGRAYVATDAGALYVIGAR